MSPRTKFRLTGLAAAILAAAAPASAQLSFTETFSTTTYRDAVNTTADWNTAAGELRLLPFAITSVGTLNTAGTATGVAVSGNLLFVADDPNVAILDITNVAAPTLLGTFASLGAQGVDIQGDLLYVAAGTSGLKIVNVTNPAAPVQTGVFNTPDVAWDVAADGDVAYVANGFSGLLVFNVSNPAAPVQIGSYNTPGDALRVDVAGNHCYVADRFGSGLLIFDVTNPAVPALVGSIVIGGDTWGVTVEGGLAYVSNASAGLAIVDVSNPATPTLLGSMDPGTVRQVSVVGDIVYAAGFSVVHVINVSDPSTPVLINTWDNPGSCNDVVVDGEHAFVADGTSGVQVIQVRRRLDPPALVDAGGGTPTSMAVAGDYMFVGSNDFFVFDISDPSSVVSAAFIATPGGANDVAVDGDHAFVADGATFRVIGIANPSVPVDVGSVAIPGGTGNYLAVAGNYAYVSASTNGLHVIDIENPASPTIVGTLATATVARGVAIAGKHAIWLENSGLRVVDVSNPASPVSVGFVDIAGDGRRLAVAGDDVCIATTAGFDRVSIANPAAPTSVVGVAIVGDDCTSVAIAGNYAFLVSTFDAPGPGGISSWLSVLDIGLTGGYVTEVQLSTIGTSGIAVAGNHVMLGNGGYRFFRVFQDEFETSANRGQSTSVDGSTETIARVRLTTSQTSGITWNYTANGGVQWPNIEPNGLWHKPPPGNDLRWRTTHDWGSPGVNPTVHNLLFEWLIASSFINSIADVPNDQGGEVRVQFARSGFDFDDETVQPVTGYQLYQRVNAATAAMVTSSSAPAARMEPRATLDGIDASRVRALGDRRFVVGPFEALAGVFPPGVWEAVGWVAATQRDVYTARVSTTEDFTPGDPNWSVYLITTHTTIPSTWFVSSIDSGYSEDNIAPGVPQNFAVAYNAGPGNTLSWTAAPEPDFQFYRVYRSTDPNFVPTAGDLVHETATPSWIDPEYDGWNVYYKVTTLDHAGNESDPASAGTTTDVPTPGVPTRYELHANAPNPFNPSTQIRYDVPVSGENVSIRVFDVSGRHVRTLVEGPQSAGSKSVRWDGRDDRGRSVASGVYFYRMQAGVFMQTRKMALLK